MASAEIVEPLGDFIRLAQPAAVLLDISNSPGEGEVLLRGLRADPEFRKLPIFALSNRTEAGNTGGAAPSFQKGAVPVAEIVKAVKGALGGSTPAEASSSANEKAPQLIEEKLTEPVAEKPSRPEAAAPGADSVDTTASPEAAEIVKQLSESFRGFAKAAESERNAMLLQMQEQVRNLRRTFLAANSKVLTAFTSALARLFITLSKDASRLNSSALRTLSCALEVMGDAIQTSSRQQSVECGIVRVLVVDDEALSRRAIQFALGCPDLDLADCDSTQKALECVQAEDFDVVFTDLKLVRDGHFPNAVRRLPKRADTPLIVVAALTEFDTRTSSLSGPACDLIAKPFTPSEMVVKAFTFALRRRLGQTASLEPAVTESVPTASPAAIPFAMNGAGRDTRAPASVSSRPVPPLVASPAQPSPGPDNNRQFAELQSRIRMLEEELAAKSAKASQEETEHKAARRQLEALSKEHADTAKNLHQQQQRLQELAKAKEAAEASAKEAARLKELEPQLKQEMEAREAHQIRVQELQKSATELEERLLQEKEERERLERENNAMRDNQENLKHQMKEHEGTVSELRDSLTRTASELQAEAARRAAAEQQAQSANTQETERLKTELQNVAAEKAQLQAKLNGLHAHESVSHPSSPSNGSVQHKLEEMTAYDLLTGELSRVRNQLVEERSQRQRLQAEVNDLEETKEDLARKLECFTQTERTRQQATETLEAKLQETIAKLASVEASLQSHSRENRRLQLRTKELEEQLGDLTSQLSMQAVLEQSRRRREAELEACIVEQQAQIANSKAALAAEGACMQRSRERIHFALCRVIQELNADKAVFAGGDRATAPTRETMPAGAPASENGASDQPAHAE